MINQVTLEGFIVSRWQYKGDEFLRIAHHRPQRKGELVHSDYITVRIAEKIENLPRLQQGNLVRVLGEVWGKDILEPLGRLFQKAQLNVELSPELEKLIVPRPTAYILAKEVGLIETTPPARHKRVTVKTEAIPEDTQNEDLPTLAAEAENAVVLTLQE